MVHRLDIREEQMSAIELKMKSIKPTMKSILNQTYTFSE